MQMYKKESSGKAGLQRFIFYGEAKGAAGYARLSLYEKRKERVG